MSSSYNLLWCSEHCHKENEKSLREELAAIARKCSADLVCLKKAAKFGAWSASSQQCRRPFALITDWREAKPCVQAFAEGASPMITLVYCDDEQSFNRAFTWAKRLNPKYGYVHAISNMKALEKLLLRAIDADMCDPTRGAWRNETCSRYPREEVRTDKAHEEAFMKSVTIDDDVERCRSLEEHVKTTKESVTRHTMMHLIPGSTQIERSLVEKLLISAMPDHYED